MLRWLLPSVLAALCAGCHNDQRYVDPVCDPSTPCSPVWQIAITPTTPAFFTSLELSVFMVEQRIELPVRRPTGAQSSALDGATGPYPRHPWVTRDDYALELQFVASNLDTQAHLVTVTINGFNEFHEYVPGISFVGDNPAVDFSGWERTFSVPPQSRVSYTVREEQLDEVAVDLATVVNGAPNSNEVVYFANQSAHDARSQMYIPPVVPALTGVRLGLRVETDDMTTTPPPIALEASLHVRDENDRIVSEGEPARVLWDLPVPAVFTPVAPMVP